MGESEFGHIMKRTRKVITSAKFRTNESSAVLHTDIRERALSVGRSRLGESGASSGLIGKVNEQCGGKNLLDHGVWLDLKFPHVIGIFGTRGTGKSFGLGVVAESVAGLDGVTSGQAPTSSVAVFDIQNQFWDTGAKAGSESPRGFTASFCPKRVGS